MTPYRRGEGFRDEAREVFRKLGSRDRRREGTRRRRMAISVNRPT